MGADVAAPAAGVEASIVLLAGGAFNSSSGGVGTGSSFRAVAELTLLMRASTAATLLVSCSDFLTICSAQRDCCPVRKFIVILRLPGREASPNSDESGSMPALSTDPASSISASG